MSELKVNKDLIENYRLISFQNAYVDEKYIWCSNVSFNSLFCIDRKTNRVNFMGNFLEEPLNAKGLHKTVLKYKECLFFVSLLGNMIHKFDLQTKKFSNIPLKNEAEKTERFLVAEAFLWMEHIYIIPRNIRQPIITIDLVNGNIMRNDDWGKELVNYVADGRDRHIYSLVQEDDIAWILLEGTSYVVQMKLSSQKVKGIYQVADGKFKFYTLCLCGEEIFLTLQDSNQLLKWYRNTEEFKIYDCKKFSNSRFRTLIPNKNGLFLLPENEDLIYKLNQKESILEPIGQYPSNFYFVHDYRKSWCKFINYYDDGDKIYIFPAGGNSMLILNTITKQIESAIELTIPTNISDQYLIRKILLEDLGQEFKKENVLLEGRNLSLQKYLNIVKENNLKLYCEDRDIKNIGFDVYHVILQQL